MAAASAEESENSTKMSTEESTMQVSDHETNKTKLVDLKVADLRAELEKRDLDKSGIKSVLFERLKNVLLAEGEDPDEFEFNSDSGNSKFPAKKRKVPEPQRNGQLDASEEIAEVEKVCEESIEEKVCKESAPVKAMCEDSTQIKESSKVKEEKVCEESSKVKEEKVCEESSKVKEEKVCEESSKVKDEKVCEESSKVKEKKVCDESSQVKEEKVCEESIQVEKISENIPEDSTNADDKNNQDGTLLLSIDEEEAQLNEDEIPLNEDENIDLSKNSDNDAVLTSTEETELLDCHSIGDISPTKSLEPSSVPTTPMKSSKQSDESKEKKSPKTPLASKTSEVATAGSPKVLKVTGKNDKIRNANTLAKSLWVTGLPNTTRAADLKILFSKQGRVLSVKIVKSTKQTPGKCHGFVTMAASKDATKAIQNLHRIEVNGRTISVERTQNESSALLKKTESKLVTPLAKKTVKKEAVKTNDSAKSSSTSQTKGTAKPEAKTRDTKSSESSKPKQKEVKAKNAEKPKSKERDQKPRERKERDAPRTAVRRPFQRAPMRRQRPFAFNERPRYGGFRRPPNSFDERVREDRERRERIRERERREAERRRLEEINRHKFIERKQREEAFRLEREKEKLRLEREILERERAEMLKMEREKQHFERERLNREREELRRQAELRRGTKRPFSAASREATAFWDGRKKAVPRYEERANFQAVKLRLETPAPRYEYSSREQQNYSRHEYVRQPERINTARVLDPAPRATDYVERESRREVTLHSREDRRPVFSRTEYRERDDRHSFQARDKQRSRREVTREDWKPIRRINERTVAPNTSSGTRRMTYY